MNALQEEVATPKTKYKCGHVTPSVKRQVEQASILQDPSFLYEE